MTEPIHTTDIQSDVRYETIARFPDYGPFTDEHG